VDAQDRSNLEQTQRSLKQQLDALGEPKDDRQRQQKQDLEKRLQQTQADLSKAQSEGQQRQPQQGNPVGAGTTGNQAGMTGQNQGGQGQK
jgi:hypothetical protein